MKSLSSSRHNLKKLLFGFNVYLNVRTVKGKLYKICRRVGGVNGWVGEGGSRGESLLFDPVTILHRLSHTVRIIILCVVIQNT